MKKRKIRYQKLFELLLLLTTLGLILYSAFTLTSFQALPPLYRLLIIAVVGLLWIILFLLFFKKLSIISYTFKQLITIALCVALVYANSYANSFIGMIDNVVKEDEATTEVEVYILVPKDSTLENEKDLANTTIGYQSDSDKENATYAISTLKQNIGDTFLEVDDSDYTSLYSALVNLETIDALVVSESFYSMLETFQPTIKEDTKIIATYKHALDNSQTQSTKDITKEPFVVLVSGLDEVGSPDQKLRSDVNILLMVNPQTHDITMIALPRDGYIPNSSLQNQNDKLTHTGIYGVDTTVTSIENFLDIDIDFYLRVSFTSLIEIVDTLGGVDVDVEITFDEQDENRSFAAEDMIHLDAGQQVLNGKQALAYARHRYTDGYDNAGRERAQQKIIAAIVNKTLSVDGLANINKLMEIMPSYVVTNIPSNQINAMVSYVLQNPSGWAISSIGNLEDGNPAGYEVTASLGYAYPQSVYLFSKKDVAKVQWVYHAMQATSTNNNFAFDINKLYDITNQSNPNFVWSED